MTLAIIQIIVSVALIALVLLLITAVGYATKSAKFPQFFVNKNTAKMQESFECILNMVGERGLEPP